LGSSTPALFHSDEALHTTRLSTTPGRKLTLHPLPPLFTNYRYLRDPRCHPSPICLSKVQSVKLRR
jgi:hypothetical protein